MHFSTVSLKKLRNVTLINACTKNACIKIDALDTSVGAFVSELTVILTVTY